VPVLTIFKLTNAFSVYGIFSCDPKFEPPGPLRLLMFLVFSFTSTPWQFEPYSQFLMQVLAVLLHQGLRTQFSLVTLASDSVLNSGARNYCRHQWNLATACPTETHTEGRTQEDHEGSFTTGLL
jgi:hypothetical protein